MLQMSKSVSRKVVAGPSSPRTKVVEPQVENLSGLTTSRIILTFWGKKNSVPSQTSAEPKRSKTWGLAFRNRPFDRPDPEKAIPTF